MKGIEKLTAVRLAEILTERNVVSSEVITDALYASDTQGESFVATLVGGSASALSTIPMDVLVAGKQSAGSAGKKMGVWETLQEKVKEKGWGGLAAYSTRGLVARCIHVALTTLMMKSMTTVVYDVLYPIDESKAKTAPKH